MKLQEGVISMNLKKGMVFAAVLCMLSAPMAAANFSVPSAFSITASAADPVYEGVKYKDAEDHIEITGCTVKEGTLEIPAEIDGKPVTVIGAAAFYGEKFDSVVIPDSVTEIAGGAFWKCANLTKVSLPSSVVSLGNHAFADCPQLAEIEIPKELTDIHELAFDGTAWMTAQREKNPFVIVNGVCIDAVQELDNILAAQQAAEEERQKALDDKNIVLIYVNEDETDEKVVEIDFPAGITAIGETVFGDLKRSINVTKLVIPEGVKNIYANAFSLCHECTEVQLPSTIEEVGDSAFADMKWLEEQPKENGLFIINGLVLDGKSAAGDVVIPEGVTAICGNAFRGNADITSVTFPSSLTIIRDFAFKRCANLKTANFAEGIKTIGEEAFSDCGLTSLVLPESLEELEYRAFITCNDLPKVSVRNDDMIIGAESLGYKNTFLPTGQYMSVYVLSVRNDFIIACRDGSTAASYAAANEQVCQLGEAGDANDDLTVDISDVILLSRFAAEDTSAPQVSEAAKKLCDMNGDGKTNAEDVTLIIRKIAKLDENPTADDADAES